MSRIVLVIALLGLAACSQTQQTGSAPAAGTYNPVSKTNNAL